MGEMLKILTRRSFAAGKVRNFIAVLAIALTAILFTSITTIGIGTEESMTLTMQMQKGSKSDGDFRNMTEEQFEMLKEADFIEAAGLRMPVNFLSNTNRYNIEFDVLDDVQAELTFCSPTHGRAPAADNEIVASDRALRDLGAEPEIGSEVVIEFTAHHKEYRLPMVVSGWYETAGELSMMWAGTAFRDAHPDIFQFTYDEDADMAGTYCSDIIAVTASGLSKKMEQQAIRMGGNPHDMRADNYLAATVNLVTNMPVDPEIVVMAALLALLFVFCCYLLIYNVFDIAVMQEIRRYGLYRTIGMSKRQVRKLMNRQALWLSGIGIPIGLFIGYFIGRAALPVIMDSLSDEYANVAAEVSPSPIIFLGAAFLTALTVLLSIQKPVRVAANIPPIEAFRYVESGAGKRKERKSALGADISRLALSNLGRNKRRSIFIIISLTLCVVLLNSVGTAAGSLDVEKQAAFKIRTDFAVTNAVSMNGMKGFAHREDALDGQVMEAILAQPGVKDGSPIYKNTAEDTDVTYEWDNLNLIDGYIDEESGQSIGFDENYMYFGVGNDQRPICNVYGMEETAIARMDLREGETNAHVLYEKMAEGKGVVVGVDVNRVDMSMVAELDMADVGETITVFKNGQPARELPVLAKAALNGDDQEIGITCNGPLKVGGNGLFLYLPANIYKELYEEPVVYKYAFNVEESQRENMTAFLEDYVNHVNPKVNYLSSQTAREDAEKTRTIINFVGGLVGLIFGFAGVLNLVNTMVTTILIRRHEFATMQSIGMTKRQLTKMMVFESVYYALGAGLLGVIFAALLGITVIRNMLESMWQYTFHFTLAPAAGVSVLLVMVSAVVPVAALRLFHKGSIVEQLRVAE